MSTPFKLKSGNNPNRKGFFGLGYTIPRLIKKGKNLLNIRSKEDALKAIGYSDKDIKGK
jgi:hypothetical protein